VEVNLKGTPAIITLVIIIIAGFGYRMFLENDLKDNPELRRQLELNLMHEIAGDIISDSEAFRAALASGDVETAETIGAGVLERKITINDIAMKGHGEKIIVRADYTVHGPEGSENKTGYFQFSHTPITGWRYKWQVSAFSWYLTLF
jgi:hypothetical protein